MMLSNLCRFSHARTLRIFGLCAALSFLFINASAQSTTGTIVLTGADRRPATSLGGEWATIVDPYFSGLFSFHHEEKKNGFFLNQKAKPGDPFPTEYDFSKAPKLKVPGDWNTQRESLFFYEGPIWYERDFTYEPKPGTHVFLHVGAANYRSWFWVNGHESLRARGRLYRVQLRRHRSATQRRQFHSGRC